jgi:hypothetical protein
VTHEPITNYLTSPITRRAHEQSQHHHDSTDQTNYQPQPNIKNRTAHLGITIRWVQEPGQIRQDEVSLQSRSVDLGQGVFSC